ncbi:MAG: DUF445 domain-containing protein [Pelosinus sp.]|nr:DUF445 domain-containing protein [Pelosinus sp.]
MNKYNKADSILCAAFLIFLLFFAINKHLPGNYVVQFCLAAAEAALIGGLADWFAVTALFRKPLGFGWHTALIPRHRAKLTAGIREMVEGNLLSSDSIRAHLAGIRLVDYVISYVEQDEQSAIDKLLGYGQKILGQLDSKENVEALAVNLKNYLANLNLLPYYQQLIDWLYQNKKIDKGLDILIDRLLVLAARPVFKTYLAALVEEYSQPKETKQPESVWDFLKGAAAKFLLGAAAAADIFNPGEMAAILQQEIINVLEEAKQPEAVLRQVLQGGLHDVRRQLTEDESLQESVRKWQNQVILKLDFQAILQAMLKSLQNAVSIAGGSAGSVLTDWLTARLQKYWRIFKQSKAMQDWLEEYLQRGVGRLAAAQHDFIGQIAVEALTSLSDEELNEFVEDKAGQDLAWIRINGSVVGAIVGAGLFLFVQEFYIPLVVPVIRMLL